MDRGLLAARGWYRSQKPGIPLLSSVSTGWDGIIEEILEQWRLSAKEKHPAVAQNRIGH